MNVFLTMLSLLLLVWSYQQCRRADFRRDLAGWVSVFGALLGWCGFLYGLNLLI